MTIFTFETILVVINGPINVRIYNILNAMLVAKAYNAQYKIIWQKESNFDYELFDIFQEVCFENKIADSVDIVKETNYYYNPHVSVDKVLSSCIAKGLQQNFPNREITDLQYIVIDNLNGKKVRMIPENILPNEEYDIHLAELNKSLLFGIQIDGYVNLFHDIQNEQEMICVYINIGDKIEDYFPYTDSIKAQLFVVFHWDHTQEARSAMEKQFRDKYENRCLFVVHETHSKMIEYLCLKHCKVVVTLNHVNDYLNENKNIVYTIKDNVARNVSFTNLQKLMSK